MKERTEGRNEGNAPPNWKVVIALGQDSSTVGPRKGREGREGRKEGEGRKTGREEEGRMGGGRK